MFLSDHSSNFCQQIARIVSIRILVVHVLLFMLSSCSSFYLQVVGANRKVYYCFGRNNNLKGSRLIFGPR